MSDAIGTVDAAAADRTVSECVDPIAGETWEIDDPAANATKRVRWIELIVLVVVLAVIITVCRGIQYLLGI